MSSCGAGMEGSGLDGGGLQRSFSAFFVNLEPNLFAVVTSHQGVAILAQGAQETFEGELFRRFAQALFERDEFVIDLLEDIFALLRGRERRCPCRGFAGPGCLSRERSVPWDGSSPVDRSGVSGALMPGDGPR